MSIRQTSIDCYNQIKAEGLLSKLRLRTLYAMIHSAPCTAGELQDYIDKNKIQVKHAWKLLSQLRDLGVVCEKTERNCKITGRVVIEWDITDQLPKNKKLIINTKKDRVNDTLIALRELYKKKNIATVEDWQKVANLIKSI
jgi:phage-related protein